MNVAIITYCETSVVPRPASLTFETLRVGYPTAAVTVFDNSSHPEARNVFKKLSNCIGADYVQIEPERPHYHILWSLIECATGRLVILDPDLVFWKDCELADFGDALLAGRRLPKFYCPLTHTLTSSRIHTSHLIVPDCQLLVENVRTSSMEWHPFRPFQYYCAPTWKREDTGSQLCKLLGRKAKRFDNEFLDRYDHLFCGTHFQHVMPYLEKSSLDVFVDGYRNLASNDISALRGVWREQQKALLVCKP